MVNPSVLIAGWVAALYLILGPLVLFGFYAFFDHLSQKKDLESQKYRESFEDKDPALWSEQETVLFLRREEAEGRERSDIRDQWSAGRSRTGKRQRA